MSNELDTSKSASDLFVFTDIEGQPLCCDKNRAHIEGLLYEISLCCERTGKFKPLYEKGAKVTPSGITIIDNVSVRL